MADKVLAPNPDLLSVWNRLTRRTAWNYDRLGLFVCLLALLASLSLLSPPFHRFDNLMLIALETAAIGIVASGQTLVILTGGIDLSVGSVVGLSGVVAAALMKGGVGPIPPLPSYLAILCALALGAGIGLAHGLLITKRNFPAFIVTLASLSVLRGTSLVLTNASPIHMLPDDFKWISDGVFLRIPVPAIMMLVIFLILGYVLRSTQLGRYAFAIGGNETAARLSGVPVDRYKVMMYVLSSLLAALSGIILIARLDGGIYTNGEGYELSSVAAVVIGGTSLNGGTGGLLGTLLGVLIMAVVRNGLVMFSISPLWHDLVDGGIILVAVLIDMERRRARQMATQVPLSQTLKEGSYLDDIVENVARLIKERLGTPYARIYFLDRKTDALVDRKGEGRVAAAAGSIAAQARAISQTVVVDALDHKGDKVVPLNPYVQSAVAVPLAANGHTIGVIEVQSPFPKSFGVEELRRLNGILQQVAIPLNDAWLLEQGWLAHETREALRHLWDDSYLGQCSLAEWAFAGIESPPEGGPAARGVKLRQFLVDAMNNLNGEKQSSTRTSRRHEVLVLNYVQCQTADQVVKTLNVSRRQYFYDLKDAVDALAQKLVTARHSAS